jgi:hypothetical protein
MNSSLGNLAPSKSQPRQTVKKNALNFSILKKKRLFGQCNVLKRRQGILKGKVSLYH